MSTRAIKRTQCAYCREEGSCRVDPREMPCGHVSCLPCLAADFSRTKIVTCPLCKSQVATSVASLPEADVKDEKVEGETECESTDPNTTSSSPYCSACTSSAASSVSMATHYCKQCDQLFCEEHLKLHAQILASHDIISSTEYEEFQSNLFYCHQHSQYLIIVGCTACHRVYCNMCLLVVPNYCFKATGSDKSHRFSTIDLVHSKVKDSLKERLIKLKRREEKLSVHISEARQLTDAVDAHLNECLQICKAARQLQIAAINEKYDDVCGDVNLNIVTAKRAIDLFITTNEEEKATLQTTIQSIENCLSSSSVREVVGARDGLLLAADEMTHASCTQFPELSIVALSSNDADNEITVHTTSASPEEVLTQLTLTSLNIHSANSTSPSPSAPEAAELPEYSTVESSFPAPPPAPLSLSLINDVTLNRSTTKHRPNEVFCAFNGCLYSLCEGNLYRYLNPSTSSQKNVILKESASCMQVRDGTLYCRQTTGESLLHIFPTQLGLVMYTNARCSIHWEGPLVESFALVDENLIVFCENVVSPRLIIFSADEPELQPTAVAIHSGDVLFQAVFITAGPKNHVAMIASEWTSVQSTREHVLAIVNVNTGRCPWKLTLEKRCDLYTTPTPVTYHNGYIYLMIFTGFVIIVDPSNGRLLRRIKISGPQTSTVATISLCVFTEHQLLFPARYKSYSQSSGSQTRDVLSFQRIEYESDE